VRAFGAGAGAAAAAASVVGTPVNLFRHRRNGEVMATKIETGMMESRAMRDIRDGWRMEERKDGRKFAESYINYLRKGPFTRT
jgi:hypothetical protein